VHADEEPKNVLTTRQQRASEYECETDPAVTRIDPQKKDLVVTRIKEEESARL